MQSPEHILAEAQAARATVRERAEADLDDIRAKCSATADRMVHECMERGYQDAERSRAYYEIGAMSHYVCDLLELIYHAAKDGRSAQQIVDTLELREKWRREESA